jgi:hypothetical protein
MVRRTAGQAAVLAAAGTMALLAGVGPVAGADAAAPAVRAGLQLPPAPWCPPHCFHHHHGPLTGLLDGVGHVLGALF